MVPRSAVLAAAAALLVLGAAYQIKGNADLIWGTDPSSAIDLRNRDIEHGYFVRGDNPFDHFEASQPPWGYLFGLALTWPEWPAVRVYFAAINAAALAFLMWWAYRQPRDATPEVRLLLAGAVLAFGGSCTATEVGQVSIVVTALLAAALWCDRNQHQYASGVLVALALIKPTISVPFAVALLITGRHRAVVAATIYGAVATAVTWAVTGASPLHMLQQMAAAAANYVGAGTVGVMDMLAAFGIVSSAQVALTPVIVGIPAAALMVTSRHSLTLAFAVAAVWGRLWTYHKSYDDVMLVLLLLPLGVVAFSTRSRVALVSFAAIGALAWIPGRLLALPEIQMLQLLVWPVALIALFFTAREIRDVDSEQVRMQRLHA